MSENDLHKPIYLTLGEAAKAANVSKPTLSKAVKEGRLSAEKQPDGSYRIQPSELFRAYPPETHKNRFANTNIVERDTDNGNPLIANEVTSLREQLFILTQERERERNQLNAQIDDLRRRLDDEAESRRIEGEERRKLTAILTDQRHPSSEPTPKLAKGFWSRISYRGTRKS